MARAGDGAGVAIGQGVAPNRATVQASLSHDASDARDAPGAELRILEAAAAKAPRPSLGVELAERTAWPSLISAVIALAVTVAVQRAWPRAALRNAHGHVLASSRRAVACVVVAESSRAPASCLRAAQSHRWPLTPENQARHLARAHPSRHCHVITR
jgi:hypothetical protein